KYYGDAEKTLRLLFDEAAKHAPSVVFFDEMDGLVPVRGTGGGAGDQIYASVVSTLLALLDGLTPRGQVVVIGATNRPNDIDPALRRPGRFDRELYFGVPTMTERMEILALHTRSWTPTPSPGLLGAVAKATRLLPISITVGKEWCGLAPQGDLFKASTFLGASHDREGCISHRLKERLVPPLRELVGLGETACSLQLVPSDELHTPSEHDSGLGRAGLLLGRDVGLPEATSKCQEAPTPTGQGILIGEADFPCRGGTGADLQALCTAVALQGIHRHHPGMLDADCPSWASGSVARSGPAEPQVTEEAAQQKAPETADAPKPDGSVAVETGPGGGASVSQPASHVPAMRIKPRDWFAALEAAPVPSGRRCAFATMTTLPGEGAALPRHLGWALSRPLARLVRVLVHALGRRNAGTGLLAAHAEVELEPDALILALSRTGAITPGALAVYLTVPQHPAQEGTGATGQAAGVQVAGRGGDRPIVDAGALETDRRGQPEVDTSSEAPEMGRWSEAPATEQREHWVLLSGKDNVGQEALASTLLHVLQLTSNDQVHTLSYPRIALASESGSATEGCLHLLQEMKLGSEQYHEGLQVVFLPRVQTWAVECGSAREDSEEPPATDGDDSCGSEPRGKVAPPGAEAAVSHAWKQCLQMLRAQFCTARLRQQAGRRPGAMLVLATTHLSREALPVELVEAFEARTGAGGGTVLDLPAVSLQAWRLGLVASVEDALGTAWKERRGFVGAMESQHDDEAQAPAEADERREGEGDGSGRGDSGGSRQDADVRLKVAQVEVEALRLEVREAREATAQAAGRMQETIYTAAKELRRDDQFGGAFHTHCRHHAHLFPMHLIEAAMDGEYDTLAALTADMQAAATDLRKACRALFERKQRMVWEDDQWALVDAAAGSSYAADMLTLWCRSACASQHETLQAARKKADKVEASLQLAEQALRLLLPSFSSPQPAMQPQPETVHAADCAMPDPVDGEAGVSGDAETRGAGAIHAAGTHPGGAAEHHIDDRQAIVNSDSPDGTSECAALDEAATEVPSAANSSREASARGGGEASGELEAGDGQTQLKERARAAEGSDRPAGAASDAAYWERAAASTAHEQVPCEGGSGGLARVASTPLDGHDASHDGAGAPLDGGNVWHDAAGVVGPRRAPQSAPESHWTPPPGSCAEPPAEPSVRHLGRDSGAELAR
ncbi:hypothetical protein CYMTET_9719, partial [Cymbomonas tetramitiformis]